MTIALTSVTRTDTTLVDGRFVSLDNRVDVHNPATGQLVGTVCWADADFAVRAVDAAERAFPAWSSSTPRSRGDLLARAADLLDERRGEIAPLLAAEAGKRLVEAEGELAFSAEYLRWFANRARQPLGVVLAQEDPSRRHLTTRSAVGVVASLTSWNFPCSLQARKIAPALAAGCTVVARVSERAPLAVTEMFRAIQDAGLPDGVLNLVHGPSREITSAFLSHRAVRAVTFTGSTAVGRSIMKQASERIVRPLLELGGDAPFVVFEDADLDVAVEAAVLAKTRNTGQSCVGVNRFLVHSSVVEEFTGRLAARLDALTIGDGSQDPAVGLGPMIDEAAVRNVQAMLDEALAGGARELTTPRDVPTGGSFLRPVLLIDVPEDSAMARTEVFGPAAAVFVFETEDEAILRANDTEMGLAAYLFSTDVSRCWRVAEKLEAGIVGINDALPSVAFAPMGGSKQSGLGREGADLGWEEFTEPKYLAWRL